MSGPIIKFHKENSREIYQYMNENDIGYYGLAALSANMPDMIELIHEVNTPVAWAALAAIFRAWFGRHKNSRIELVVQDHECTRQVTLTGYNPKELNKLGLTKLIMAAFTELNN